MSRFEGVLISEGFHCIFDIAWEWSVYLIFREDNSIKQQYINITDTTEGMVDVTTISYFIGNEIFVLFSCQADTELLNGSDITAL